MPKVSVLVPVYNGGKYLAECLESILAQDFENMEILISDNCSTDDTVAVIKKFAARDARIRWWTNLSNLGCVGNSNACLQQAQGEYVKFVYHDDLLVSNQALTTMVSALDLDPEISLVVSATKLISKNSEFISIWNPQGRSQVTDGKRVMLDCLERKSDNDIGCPSMSLFRRQQATRGFNPQFSYMMDTEMWFYLLEQGSFCWLAEPQAAFRIHSEQFSEELRQPNFRNSDSLLLLQHMMEKDWFWKRATDRLFFVQIYYKRKIYGKSAELLTAKLMSRLTWKWYFYQYLLHKFNQPIQKFSRKLNRLSAAN